MPTITAFPDLLPFFRAGSDAAIGEALYAVAFRREADGEIAAAAGARPWSQGEVAALLRALGRAGPAHGHSMAVGEAIVDVVRGTDGRRGVHFLVWQQEELIRVVFSEDPQLGWEAVDPAQLEPWLAARRGQAAEAGEAPARRGRRVVNPLRLAVAGTREIVDLTSQGVSGALGVVGHLRHEPYWQAELTVGAMMVLSLSLHKRFQVGPVWLMAVLEGLLLIALFLHDPKHGGRARHLPEGRLVTRIMLGVVTLANTISLFTLVHELLKGSTAGGHPLILASVVIWLTNVGIFALAFWELDRGGPELRVDPATALPPKFLFPQMTLGGEAAMAWQPSFVDYLYVSFTNATAFSPTDTMPLGSWAKVLMLIESLASLVTVGLVAARAVNILK